MNNGKIKRGQYFYTSWGYDQTNIDYLRVISISPSGKTAICRMADGVITGESGTSEALKPGKTYSPSFRMVVKNGDLRGSYPYCKGHKSRRLGTFWPTTAGQTQYQTMAQFGH